MDERGIRPVTSDGNKDDALTRAATDGVMEEYATLVGGLSLFQHFTAAEYLTVHAYWTRGEDDGDGSDLVGERVELATGESDPSPPPEL